MIRSIIAAVGVFALTLGCMVSILMPVERCRADEVFRPKLAPLVLPSTGAASRGFSASVQLADQNVAGCVAAKITITSTTRFTADRNFTFRFEPPPGARMPPENGLVIDVAMSVDEGAKSRAMVCYLPKWSAGNVYRVTMLEGGQPLPGYGGVSGAPVFLGNQPITEVLAEECRADWLYLSEKDRLTDADRDQIEQQFTAAIEASPVTQTAWGRVGGISMQAAGQDELPCDWRGYQRYDLVIVTDPALEKLLTRSDEFKALRQWLLTGGAVLGYEIASPQGLARRLGFVWRDEDDFRQIVRSSASDALERRESELAALVERKQELELSLSEAERRNAFDATLGGPTPALTVSGGLLEEYQIELNEVERLLSLDKRMRKADPSRNLTAAQWTERVWIQSAGAGLLLGFRDDASGISDLHWQIAKAAMDYRISPTLRRGADPLIGDRRFSEWIIPGVAQPPVYTFIGLLTVFVILVGPVAYRRTTRYGRGYLMFAIAPLLAMVTTLAMFGYGIISDGFGTVARVRQLTWIDGPSGDGGQRTRSTYFAGVRPGDGLRFPATAEVVRYPDSTGASLEELNESAAAILGKVSLSDRHQRFDSSFLPSRQQRQFVVHQPLAGIGAIVLETDAGGSPRLSSTLDFPLRRVIACDASGKYWIVDQLGPGQTIAGQRIPTQDVSRMLGEIYNEFRPVSAVRQSKQQVNYRRSVRDLVVTINRSIGDGSKTVIDGSFERWLRTQLQLRGELPTKHFVAIAEVSDDVVAVEETELVESVRYVFGTMR